MAKAAGFPLASRSYQTPQLDGDLSLDPTNEPAHIEVRLRKSLSVGAWAAEVEAVARRPFWAVLWRRRAEPWRATVDASALLRLLAFAQANGYKFDVDH